MQLLSLYIHHSGFMLPCSSAAFNREPSSEENEKMKMVMRNAAKTLRMAMAIALTGAAANDSSNEDGYQDDVGKFVEVDIV